MTEKIINKYKELFVGEFLLVRAPGRINLIGEHTDYNEGFVFPAAVGQEIQFAIGKSGDEDSCTLVSLDYDESFTFNLSELKPEPSDSWQNFILGVAAEIIKSGRKLHGFNLVFSGNIPLGSGMSSSAALECGSCFSLNELFELKISKLEMVKLSQMAEHNYAGVKCGIMDQFASMFGSMDHAILLDCKDLSYDYFPLNLETHTLVLCNSNVSHSLASSQYNIRRQQCEEGVKVLNQHFWGINSLRDASLEQFESAKKDMTEVVQRRCKYVIEENIRVAEFAKALEANNLIAAGSILKKAQAAMRDEYEITCPEIDFMADFANSRNDIAGARMMGGGFGGCTLNLVKKEYVEEFISDLNVAYQEKFNKEITPIRIEVADGVARIA